MKIEKIKKSNVEKMLDPVMAILEKKRMEVGEPITPCLQKVSALSPTEKADIAKLKDDVSIIKRKQAANELSSLRHYKKLLKFMNAHKAKKNLDKIEDRLSYLAKKLRCEIGKNMVLREVSRCYPVYLPHLTKALDHPDSWWEAKEHFTIDRWARFLKDDIQKKSLIEKEALDVKAR
jgi:hypothetical protein